MTMSSACCFGCSRFLIVLISILFLLIGFSLACLILWLGFDNNFEHQLRQTLLSDPAQAPPELADIKSVFQQTYFAIFWGLIALGLVLSLIGFFSICGACTTNRLINIFICLLLGILILLQVVALLAIILYKNSILARLNAYLSTSLKYNLSDADVLQNRFICCGDGDPLASYNYQCSASNRPNCQQILNQWFNAILAGIGISISTLIFLEFFTLILFTVILCHRKGTNTIDEIH